MPRAITHHVDQVWAVVAGHASPPVDSVVQKSWARSANAHGVDPGSRQAPRILTVGELVQSQESASRVIEAARPELDQLYHLLRAARYVILLCDTDGMVVDHRGEESDAAQYRHWGTWLGGVWSEEAEGTNGIGTCVAEGRAVTIHRAQHFRVRHIDLSCSGAPIFDGDAELVGVLDVSSIDPQLSEHAHALTGTLTVAAARAIEERLFRKQFHRQWTLATGPPDEPGAAMLISIDGDQRVVGADRNARRVLLRSAHARLEDELGLWSLFERNDALFAHMDRGDVFAEVRRLGGADLWPAIVTPPEPALARWGQTASEDLRLRPRLDTLALRPRSDQDQARGGLAPSTLRRIRDYVDSHLEQTIDLESLAATAELSLYHFARAFKQSEGTTPHTFVLERRVAKARQLLTDTRLPLSEIALIAGFADQSHFARRFRQAVGVSPGAFRRQQG